jgi:hypothetical protein
MIIIIAIPHSFTSALGSGVQVFDGTNAVVSTGEGAHGASSDSTSFEA